MVFKFPDNIDECLYFTNRKLEDGTKILAFVTKKICPSCGKGKMGKPKDPKTGKIKIRSTEYICPSCGFSEGKKEHEESLSMEVQYTNPEGTELKTTYIPYKRKTWKKVPAFVFFNEFINEKVGITKRLKSAKKK